MLAQKKDYVYEEEVRTSGEDASFSTKLQPLPRVKKRPRVVLNTALRSRCQVLFVLVTVLAMAVTIRSGISASRGYALVATQQEAIELEQENERLRIEIAHLKSPNRIMDKAASNLGMKIPSNLFIDIENSMSQ